MKISDSGLLDLVLSEAVVPYPYRDSVGVWTFGVGHTRAAGPPDPAKMPRGISPAPLDEVFALLRRDVVKYEKIVDDAISVPMKQTEFDALVSFVYNVGHLTGTSIEHALNSMDREGAARAFDLFHRPPAVTDRRNREKRLFRDGHYSSDGHASVYPANALGAVLWSKGRRVDVRQYIASAELARTPPPAPARESEPEPSAPAPQQPEPETHIVEPAPAPSPSFWSVVAELIGRLIRRLKGQ